MKREFRYFWQGFTSIFSIFWDDCLIEKFRKFNKSDEEALKEDFDEVFQDMSIVFQDISNEKLK